MSLSRFLDSTTTKYSTLLDRIHKLLQTDAFQKIVYDTLIEMIQSGVEEQINIYEWDLIKIIREKWKNEENYQSFNSFLFHHFREKTIQIFSIFLNNINRNQNLDLFISQNQNVARLWQTIIAKTHLPVFHILKADDFTNSRSPFSYHIYSIIEENKYEKPENKELLSVIQKEICRDENTYADLTQKIFQRFPTLFI
ncbi:hypothetical protein M0811_03240 [Anaeramoeba ignava]|uniref:Uncharacterized protein n=1 Tax=Anaeramoeba ignava TaxID=1746090 RepID=A0A9Q0R5C0_ANAIG|nr:hypothetical protein M0811_03240 [Anaeramoeba ignava]